MRSSILKSQIHGRDSTAAPQKPPMRIHAAVRATEMLFRVMLLESAVDVLIHPICHKSLRSMHRASCTTSHNGDKNAPTYIFVVLLTACITFFLIFKLCSDWEAANKTPVGCKYASR